MLKELGKVVLLWAEPEEIYKRVGREKHRPLLNVDDPQAEIVKLLERRRPSYQAVADLTIDTTRLSVAEVVEKITKELQI